jgi:hypothetical protein
MNDKTDSRYWLGTNHFVAFPGFGHSHHRQLLAEELASWSKGKTPTEQRSLHLRAENRTEAFTQYLSNIERLFGKFSENSQGRLVYKCSQEFSTASFMPVLW